MSLKRKQHYFNCPAGASSSGRSPRRCVELITKIIHHQGKFRVYAAILAGSDNTNKEVARQDMGTCLRDFAELTEQGAAILPVELWREIKQFSNQMITVLVRYDDGEGITEEDKREFMSRSTKVALISRAVLGADELTEESIKLFLNKRDYDRLTSLQLEYFDEIYDKKHDGNQ